LYLLAFTAPLEVYRTAVGGVDVSLFRLSLLVALGVYVREAGDPGRDALRCLRHPLIAAYLLLGGVVLLAMLVHPIDPYLGGRQAAQIAIGVFTIAVISELVRRSSIERLIKAIVVGSYFAILGAAWQAMAPKLGQGRGLPLLGHLPAAPGLEVTRQALSSFGPVGARAKGTFGDPNHFGVYLVFVAFLAFGLTMLAGRRGDRRAQVAFAAITTAALATVVATFSRSAWIATLLGALIVLIAIVNAWRAGNLRTPRLRIAAPVIIGALGLSAGVIPSVAQRVGPSSEINVVSDRGHARTVRFAFHQFTAHPVIGIGPGGLGVKLKQPSRTSGAHSTYLTIAAELGTIGLLVLVGAAAVALRLALGAYMALRRTDLEIPALALLAAYAGFLGANVTYDVGFDDFHWLILGALAAIAATTSAMAATSPATTPADRALNGRRSWRARLPISGRRLRASAVKRRA
jgi:O-antigen ligase